MQANSLAGKECIYLANPQANRFVYHSNAQRVSCHTATSSLWFFGFLLVLLNLRPLAIVWPISLVCLMWKPVGSAVWRHNYSSDEPQKKTRGLPWLVNNGCWLLHYADDWIFTLKTSKSCWMWARFKLNPACFFPRLAPQGVTASNGVVTRDASRAFKTGIVFTSQIVHSVLHLLFFFSSVRIQKWAFI